MSTKVWNYFYDISHRLFMDGWSNWEISMKFWKITKMEVFKETPKKYRIKFTILSTWNSGDKINKTVKTKLYDKSQVNVTWKQSLESLFTKLENYKITVEESEKIALYKKKAILEELNKFTKENITELFTKQ